MKFLKTQSGATQTLNRIDVPASWPLPGIVYNGATLVEDPTTCKDWRTITNPEEIEHYIRLRNHGHFGQAQGTPFTELPLRDEINWTADTPTCEDILNGHHQLDTISSIPKCQALLDTCRSAATFDLLPYYISNNEFEQKIKIWSKTTTTSPSGRHLGHYKVLLQGTLHTPPTHHGANKTRRNYLPSKTNLHPTLHTGHHKLLPPYRTLSFPVADSG